MRIAGCKGAFAAFVLDADIRSLLREGALEALGGQLDSCCDVVSLRKQGVDLSLELSHVGRHILSVVAFEDGRPNS